MSLPEHLKDSKYLWRNVSRAEIPQRSATARIADFLEVYCCFTEETAREQASRCLQCPDAPCVEGCPMGNQIPRWVGLVEEGRFKEATEVLSASGCMPDVMSNLCRQTCEEYCVLEGVGAPVSINAIERFLNHYAEDRDLANTHTQAPNGLRVAVVGSGPCALACCLELARGGYAVTVFDSQPVPGGFLLQGIPAFKLDKSVVQRRIRQLQQMGVEFRMNVRWGQTASLQSLRSEFHAVFLGPCAEKTKSLEIPGRDLRGIYQGLDFIVQQNFPWASPAKPIEVKGKRVVVLGGGDTAIDCTRTALRRGASQVTCLYRREQGDMPCSPKELQQALEEGAKIEFSTLASALLGDDGQVTKVRCVRTAVGAMDANGRPDPVAIAGSELEMAADVVMVAFGFVRPAILAESQPTGMALNGEGGIAVDEQQMTSLPGVFAAGTVVSPSLLLPQAVRDGRKAAHGIEAYLNATQRACATSGCAAQPAIPDGRTGQISVKP